MILFEVMQFREQVMQYRESKSRIAIHQILFYHGAGFV